MSKRIKLSFFGMLFSVFVMASDIYLNGINYTLDSESNTASVVSCDKNISSFTIEDTIVHNNAEYIVTAIGARAFYNCSTLTGIILPSGITTIGNNAFYGCINLTSIEFPENVTSIGNGAFYYCEKLTSITIPENVISIGNKAFYGCFRLCEVFNFSELDIVTGGSDNGYVAYYAKSVSTDRSASSKLDKLNDFLFYVDADFIELIAYTGVEQSIALPTGYKGKNYGISYCAFNECESLTDIIIPEGVTTIGDAAFYGCSRLTDITIPASVTAIGEGVFGYCASLSNIEVAATNTNYCSVDGVLYNMSKTALLAYPSNTIGTVYSIPNSVQKIGEYAFSGSKLTNVTMPESVTAIGNSAFSGCSKLVKISIPEGVTILGDYVFDGCNQLTDITIPESVTAIGEMAFSGCSSLTGIELPESVTTIGNFAFRDCSGLTGITIPESITVIGDGTFYGCNNINGITIPESVTTIGGGAFYNCKSLADITIPESVTAIGEMAFYGCSGLTSITCGSAIPPILPSASVFSGVDQTIPLYVLTASVDAYKAADYWNVFVNIEALEENPTSVENISEFGNVSINVNGNVIQVYGTNNYTVYSVTGENLGSPITLSAGLYIINVAGKCLKVVVK